MTHIQKPNIAGDGEQDTGHHDHDHVGGHGHGHGHGRSGGKIRSVVSEIFAPHSHDAADSIDDVLESSTVGIRAVKISLIVLGVTPIRQR